MLLILSRKALEHFLKIVDSVTLQDITKISQKLISSPLTMASYGDGISHLDFFLLLFFWMIYICFH